MVLANGHYWLFYSGNWYNQPKYAIGVAQCQGPAGPCSKARVAALPELERAGAGAPASLRCSPTANGLWMVYGPVGRPIPDRHTKRPVALVHIDFNCLRTVPGRVLLLGADARYPPRRTRPGLTE